MYVYLYDIYDIYDIYIYVICMDSWIIQVGSELGQLVFFATWIYLQLDGGSEAIDQKARPGDVFPEKELTTAHNNQEEPTMIKNTINEISCV